MALERELWQIIEDVGYAITPGITTNAIAARIAERLAAAGMTKGYPDEFPSIGAISVDEEACNGIPSDREIHAGSLVSIDVAARRPGAYATAGWTFPIQCPDDPLLDAARAGLRAGLSVIRAGVRVGDLGAAIQAPIEARGFFVVRDFVGHVIVGDRPFQPPQLPSFGIPGTGKRLRSGMRLALHIIAKTGDPSIRVLDNQWTAVGAPGTRTVQLSATVDVTEDGRHVIGCLHGFT